MDKERQKLLKEQYKEMKTWMGVYQVRNTQNGKIMIGASPNLKNRWLTLRQQLDMGNCFNTELQKEWKQFGSEAFTYEVLEEKVTEGVNDVPWEMEQMKKAWVEKLQPFGERGYHKQPVR
jgi:frataxin-like iron-binding protein CyaY